MVTESNNLLASSCGSERSVPEGTGRRACDPTRGYSTVTPEVSPGLVGVLWRARWIVLICVVASLVGGLVYINAATPIYTATTKLYLDYENISITQSYGPGLTPRVDKYLHTQAARLRSRSILAEALATLSGRPLRTLAEAKVPVAYLQNNIDVSVGKKDEIIRVSLDSPYPVEGVLIVNAVVEAYIDSRSEDKQEDATRVLNRLQAEMKLRRSDLEAKRNELKAFQANSMPLALGSEEGGGVMQSHLQCQSQYNQAKTATQRAKQHLDTVQKLATSPTALRQYLQAEGLIGEYSTDARERTALETRGTELDLRKTQLLETFTTDHPAVASLGVEMDRIENRLAALDDRFVTAVKTAAQCQLAQAQANETQRERSYTEQSAKVRQLSTELFQYRQLLSEVEYLQTSTQTLEQEVDEIRKIVGEDVGQMRIEILEPAERAEEPSWPQRPKVLAMALMCGLFLGGGIGLARDWLDQTLHSVDEIAAALDLPILGVVPLISRRYKLQMRAQWLAFQPDSPEAEAFRTVRTAVFFGASGDHAKTLLVTSPCPGDGKSTLVSNLGIAMANAGQKVLILDADLRRPVQHRVFDIDDRDEGAHAILNGTMRLVETQVAGLSLLICTQPVSNPAEFLNSQRFAKTLETLAERYDRVLVDAPPATVVTDAQILGAICDYAIFVLKAGKSTHRAIRRAVEALQSVGTEFLGVVVNEVKTSKGAYGYYHKYTANHGIDSGNGSHRRWHGKVGSVAPRLRGRLVSGAKT